MADKVREAGCPDGYGDRHAAKCENAVVAARVIEGAWGDGYIAGRRAAAIRALPLAPAASAPADDAVTLLADARKCVALCNTNGYYDVWLTRCDRVLANAKRSADERTANGGV